VTFEPEGSKIMLFGRDVDQRIAAIRAGWNDAAWDRPARLGELVRTNAYAQGVAGGAMFRQRRAHDVQASELVALGDRS
jgi:hypothetical protein